MRQWVLVSLGARPGMVREVQTTARLTSGVVLIGGSAGAFEPLLVILEGLPPTFSLPIVIVLHLPSASCNELVRALSRRATLPVREAEDKAPVEAGTVFVAPAGYHLLIERAGSFALSLDPPERSSRPSIDVLFESAAHAFGSKSIGLVLSGANSDGAAGLAAISRAGGRVLVQRTEDAAYAEMPRAALARCPGAEALETKAIVDRLVSLICVKDSK